MSLLFKRHSLYCKIVSIAPAWAFRKTLEKLIHDSKFAVVSNNCWGAHVYKRMAIPYMTPFVGVSLSSDAYLDLLENWHLLGAPLVFRQSSWDVSIERIRQERRTFWPIGVLGERVEVQFMHETDFETAKSKWERRLLRMSDDRNRIFLKFDDLDGVCEAKIRRFLALDFPNKVFFTATKDLAMTFPSAIYIPTLTGELPDGLTLSKISPLYFDSAAWISGRRQPRLNGFRGLESYLCHRI
jgi:uncharacterized protein (DUF1919 family)